MHVRQSHKKVSMFIQLHPSSKTGGYTKLVIGLGCKAICHLHITCIAIKCMPWDPVLRVSYYTDIVDEVPLS